MQVPCRKDLASHSGPESCAVTRKGGREALTGERVGQPLSSETFIFRDADAFLTDGRQHQSHRYCEVLLGPAESKTLSTHGSLVHGSRESPQLAAADGATVRAGNPKGAIPR